MLKGIVALVTGGAGTLGLATVQKLVSEGSKVVILDLPTSKGESLAQKIGPDAIFCAGDICSEEDVTKALDLTNSNFGKLNLLVNCAGTMVAKTIFNFNTSRRIDKQEISDYVQNNLTGTLNVIRIGVETMAKNQEDENGLRGLVINTGGFAAFDGQSGHVLSGAVWGAIASMTQPLCRDLSPVGIRVVTISPGLFDSKATNILPKKLIDCLSGVTPAPKRLGKPEEFAKLVLSIVQNPMLNGEVIRLDGGLRFFLH